ncbi:spastin isoform X1 [Amborella trichopoda]|uniref:spastin isoform X1 n=1 Tax=Amborella trichopoda TaxID=13333 RepID=UPI0009BE552B|nr:spastin isoform X1 [Amborella trichopoda]XP_020518900.1 spastin isoform X1 [Amborella trichopoda]XP_020518901.1 spastin isoform X1 [Amborella trichopoda]XP_020518902.1 spastin isoform X1 [Amborella trichopoda]XP_020518903.1 spastin isoform X1 [Amborella trichopoda]|eukprot:XP_020518899.1 spastin isoform X1 [Amborella trichopoda]
MKRLLRHGRTLLPLLSQSSSSTSSFSLGGCCCGSSYFVTYAGSDCGSHSLMYSKVWRSESASNSKFYSILQTIFAGALVGSTMLEFAQAEADIQPGSASQSPSNIGGNEKRVGLERERVEELLRKKGLQRGSYPPFIVAVKGQQVTLRFQVPSHCEVHRLIVDLVSRLGLKTDLHVGGSEMKLHAWDSAVAWQLTLSPPEEVMNDINSNPKTSGGDSESLEVPNMNDGKLYIVIFESLIGSSNVEIEFIKQGSFTAKELDAIACALKIASSGSDTISAPEKKHRGFPERRDKSNTTQAPVKSKSLEALEAMGVKVFGLDESNTVFHNYEISWDIVAGYYWQKREIEDTVLLALHSPDVYDNIARGTRRKFESNRPRAVLFEGPPGTGKTSCARVIANQAGVPLLYVPLEVVMSKYYGESERLLGTVFSLANDLPTGAIIFLDEVDSFAATRDSEMHEATRRVLSVLLRQIDGFEQDKRVIVIAATNRKQDLDPALISRFDAVITFDLPNQQDREEIAAQYARHLNKTELAEFSVALEGMSGRDIRDVCQQAERHWASKIIRKQIPSDAIGGLPPLQEYVMCALDRRRSLLTSSETAHKNLNYQSKRRPVAFAS